MHRWEEKSAGYHSDDGKVSGLAAGNAYGPTFGLGDIVGAGLNLISGKSFLLRMACGLVQLLKYKCYISSISHCWDSLKAKA